MEGMFEVLQEQSDLPSMTLDELVILNTQLSQLREAAGGDLRQQIYDYALEVNRYITLRSMDREENIQAQIAADPKRALLHQGVRAFGIPSSTRFGG